VNVQWEPLFNLLLPGVVAVLSVTVFEHFPQDLCPQSRIDAHLLPFGGPVLQQKTLIRESGWRLFPSYICFIAAVKCLQKDKIRFDRLSATRQTAKRRNS
jgi:hypothetical protein